jgi:hypothetical protein
MMMGSVEDALTELLQHPEITTETLAVAAMRAELARRGKKFPPPRGADAALAGVLLRHGIGENPLSIRSLLERLRAARAGGPDA